MAVYERRYRPWRGTRTAPWKRFAVIPKYICKDLFAHRLFSQFYVGACVVVPMIFLGAIYASYNLKMLEFIDFPPELIPEINGQFFYYFLYAEGWLALFLSIIVGPSLISMDLANGALPLYLSRPLTRLDYVLGKVAVLGILISLMTWVPGWALFAVQASLSREPYFLSNLRIPMALFVGSWAWIIILSLLTLAVSAYVKRKHVARVALFGPLFMLTGFGQALFEATGWEGAHHFKLVANIQALWSVLLALRPDVAPVPALAILLVLSGVSAGLLYRRIRPMEIMR